MSLDKAAIDKIQELSLQAAGICNVDGINYSAMQMRAIRQPEAEPLQVNSLEALVLYLDECTVEPEKNTFFHVVDPTTVRLVSRLEVVHRTREVFLQANASETGFKFGSQYDVESFIIALQAGFVKTETRDEVLKMVGNIVHNSTIKHEDDGVTQVVTVKQGIGDPTWKPLPNPVYLAPWRTFAEVEQPESGFILRVAQGREGKPAVSLHAVEDPLWRQECVRNIAQWLQPRVVSPVIV